MTQDIKDCKVLLFLENHYDLVTIWEATHSLLPFFSEQGFRTFCLETFLDLSDQFKKNLELIENAKKVLKMYIYLSEWERQMTRSDLEATIREHELENKVFSELVRNHISYCAMDKPPKNGIKRDWIERIGSERDEHMAKVIYQKCADGNVLANVGLGHHKPLRKKLLEMGLSGNNVKGYFAPSISEEDLYVWNDLKELRSGPDAYFEHKSDNIVVIDLLKDSSLNTTDLIIQSYIESFLEITVQDEL